MIVVHGFILSMTSTQLAWQAMAPQGAFTTANLQSWLTRVHRKDLDTASAAQTGRHVSIDEIANRTADRLVTKWKKSGLIEMRRPSWVVLKKA